MTCNEKTSINLPNRKLIAAIFVLPMTLSGDDFNLTQCQKNQSNQNLAFEMHLPT